MRTFIEGAIITEVSVAKRIVDATVLGGAKSAADLGPNYGATLTAAEVAWLRSCEFAQTSEDILWRRTRLGLQFTPEMTAKLTADMEAGP